MTKIKYLIIVFIFIILIYPLPAQEVHNIFSKVKIEFTNQNYYAVLNLCREIEKICSESPVSECYFTNVMKNVYRYKGLSEFEIYKRELKPARLNNSIQSLEISYGLYRDAEILYTYGYLLAIQAILLKNINDLDGFVKAWKGIIELYGHNNWQVNKDLLEKIKDYIKVTEKFVIKVPSKRYGGHFAKFMIIMACDLAENAQLNYEDQNFFNKYRKKYKTSKINRLLDKLTE
jgi:hypothetical protein